MNIKTGFGIDFHQLVEQRDLWLGGVKIPHTKGALGHSDADVLLHAICDALLGAAALGDIGVHFPDTSAEFKDIDSKILLKHTVQLVIDAGYCVGNIDAALCLQAPKIKPYMRQMQQTIADIVGIMPENVSIKATTTEKLGFVGREEGVVAYASALLLPANPKIKIINQSNNPLPAYETSGSSGMDIRAFLDEPVLLHPLERVLIPTGLFIELPEGHEAQIRPRSGLAIKQGLTCLNTPGTIDADYRGEIKIIIVNLSNEAHSIQNGDRIAQMVIQKVEKAIWIKSDTLNTTKRGEGGFGHTGV